MSHSANQPGYRPHSRERLRELILYIAAQSADDEKFGDVKFNKLLYFADFTAYERLGSSITGQTYHKLEQGPCAKGFKPVRDRLEQDGAIKLKEFKAGNAPKPRIHTFAIDDPNTDCFSDQELAIVDDVIKRYRSYNGGQMADLSHRVSLGWRVARDKEDIPYESVHVSAHDPSPAVLEIVSRRLGVS